MTKALILILVSILISGNAWEKLKNYESWWQKNLENSTQYETFDSWLGDADSPQRKALREHAIARSYSSILDAACGLCIEYDGLKKDGIDIEYQGLDITPKLVERANSRGIPVVLGSIENIPFEDRTFDLAYGRHILEHLEYYELALAELIRVAKKEVFISFFIDPSTAEEIKLTLCDGGVLYHNVYEKTKLERFILNHPKVRSIEWDESILHIYLN